MNLFALRSSSTFSQSAHFNWNVRRAHQIERNYSQIDWALKQHREFVRIVSRPLQVSNYNKCFLAAGRRSYQEIAKQRLHIPEPNLTFSVRTSSFVTSRSERRVKEWIPCLRSLPQADCFRFFIALGALEAMGFRT